AADADRDSGITENGAESFAGKYIRGKRGKNHRARTEADAEKNNVHVEQPRLAGVVENHQSADADYRHNDVQSVGRLLGQAIGNEAEDHPAETAGNARQSENRSR